MTTQSIGLLMCVQYITRKTTDCLKARLLKERAQSSFDKPEVEFINNKQNLLDSTYCCVLLLQPKSGVYSRCMKTVDVRLFIFFSLFVWSKRLKVIFLHQFLLRTFLETTRGDFLLTSIPVSTSGDAFRHTTTINVPK